MPDDKEADELRPLFTCTLCRELYADPVRLRLCGHTFCHYCLVKHLREERSCPQCSRSLDHVGHKAYTTDLGLQELTYRCFPNETVQAMRRKFELISSKKSIMYQLCSVNLVYLLQHHVSTLNGKVRVKIRMNQKRIVNVKSRKDHQTDNTETMILHCEQDIPISSIKKLFAHKFQLPISTLRLFSSDSLNLDDEDTIGEVILRSGGFDGVAPIQLIVRLREDTQEEEKENEEELLSEENVDDDMPVLEAEVYESQSPPPILPILELEQPSCSTQHSPVSFEEQKPLPILTNSIEQKPYTTKRPNTSEIAKPPKIKRVQSKDEIKPMQPPQQDMMAFFNKMMNNASTSQMPVTPPANPATTIFAPPTKISPESPLFNNKTSPGFPFMQPDFATNFYVQMLNSPLFRQKMGVNSLNLTPNRSPFPFTHQPFNLNQPQMFMQNLMADTQTNELWRTFLQMNGTPKVNVKKPSTTVKPMRRESNKLSTATSMDNRVDKNGSIDGFKTEPANNSSNDNSDCFPPVLTCTNI